MTPDVKGLIKRLHVNSEECSICRDAHDVLEAMTKQVGSPHNCRVAEKEILRLEIELAEADFL